MHVVTRNVNSAFRDLVTAFQRREDGRLQFGTFAEMNSRQGKVTYITEPVTISYYKPLERVLLNKARDANPFFHLYEALWMLAGRDDVESINYFNKKVAELASDDGKTFNGAYGKRWRRATFNRPQAEELDQINWLVDHLKGDKASRRAVLQMWNVEDDLLNIGVRDAPGYRDRPASKDVCCNLSVIFSLRPGLHPNNPRAEAAPPEEHARDGMCYYLDMSVTNRSNDLILGTLGSDFVTFSVLQEYVAARLGVQVGAYHQISTNLHVYEWNFKPEEWLAGKHRAYPGEAGQPQYKTVPLVHDPAQFEKELPIIVGHFGGPLRKTIPLDKLMKEPFLRGVAGPMFTAYDCHRGGLYDSAMKHLSRVAAEDWRLVATEWITKRHERRVAA